MSFFTEAKLVELLRWLADRAGGTPADLPTANLRACEDLFGTNKDYTAMIKEVIRAAEAAYANNSENLTTAS